MKSEYQKDVPFLAHPCVARTAYSTLGDNAN